MVDYKLRQHVLNNPVSGGVHGFVSAEFVFAQVGVMIVCCVADNVTVIRPSTLTDAPIGAAGVPWLSFAEVCRSGPSGASRSHMVDLAVHLLHPVDESCVREAGRVRATSLAELPRYVRSEQQRYERGRQSLRVVRIDH
jgi:hypothetical protein